jgi:hypothetical protein
MVKPPYVHGAKHLLDAPLRTIAQALRTHRHKVIVDPFPGSGTLVSLSPAQLAHLSFWKSGDPKRALAYIDQTKPITTFDLVDVFTFLLKLKRIGGYGKDGLLLLDPPRVDSKHYASPWTMRDQVELLQNAVEWPGPVVMCGYHEDTPALLGGGWVTDVPEIPKPIDELTQTASGPSPRMFISHRGALE